MSKTYTEPRREKKRCAVPNAYATDNNNNNNNSQKMRCTEVLSFSLSSSLTRLYTAIRLRWVVVAGIDDEEEKLWFISYVYIHTYIYGRIWADRFSLFSSLPLIRPLYVYLSSVEQPLMAM